MNLPVDALALSLAAVCLMALPSGAQPRPASDLFKLNVTIDTDGAPDVRSWAEKAKALVEKWYPTVERALRTRGFKPTRSFKITFKEMEGIAYAGDDGIVVAAKWIREHSDDWGMIIHEMTHVIQRYPTYDPSWLVEGIADYVRFFMFEPKVKVNVNPDRSKYTDAYRTTAAFLDWIVRNRDPRFINRMNEALRMNKYHVSMWEKHTGKTIDALWTEYTDALRKTR